MKKINAIISSFAFLLLAVLMSACNKDGIETIVIEDGQPSLAQMLIGRWNPTGGEMANPNTGEVTEDINISDIPWLDFGENGIGSWGNGGSGTGGSAGESFDWNADEGSGPIIGGGSGYDGEGPSVTFGGERWYIFQLTERILIIYRFYGDYIIIYYYYRVGDYNEPEPEPTPEPDNRNVITEIRETTLQGAAAPSVVKIHSFAYDDEGRIQNYTIIDGDYTYEWTYSYEGVEEVYVSGSESYMGYIGVEGINSLYSLPSSGTNQVLVASPQYNSDGYMQSLNNNVLDYENGNLSTFNCRGSVYTYEYTGEKNNANIDLNCFISNCSMYEYDYSHFSLFAPFGFYGKSSENLISKEIWFESADFDYEYTYEKDEQGRISSITRRTVPRFSGNILSMTTYRITYAN